MLSDDTAALVKQVRDYLESHKRVVDLPDERFEYETPPSARPALAAITTLAARLDSAEQDDSAAWEDMRAYNLRLEERAWAAEAEVKRLRGTLTRIASGAESNSPNEVAEVARSALTDEPDESAQ